MRDSMLFKIVPMFIVVVFIIIILWYIGIGIIAVKCGYEINKHGLSGVINHIWEGSNP